MMYYLIDTKLFRVTFQNYFRDFVPSYVQLGISFSWGFLDIHLLKFEIGFAWGKEGEEWK